MFFDYKNKTNLKYSPVGSIFFKDPSICYSYVEMVASS
jgi:hypothetical protein